MYLPNNEYNEYTPPRIYLCGADKEKINELQPVDFSGTFKFNSINEISFSIYRYLNHVISGEQYVAPYYSRIEAFYLIYLEGYRYYQLQDCTIVSEGMDEHKECVAYSLEYNLTQKYLELFSVNTGTEISIEGDSTVYELAESYDPAMLYYEKIDGVYVMASVEDEYEFADGTYYVNTSRVRLYWPEKPELSLMHRVLEKAPDWKVGYVAPSLKYQERTFEIDRESIYDFIVNTMCPAFKCIAEFDTINNVINLYPEDESDESGYYDTDIYVSFQNLAKSMQVDYAADDIKTVLKVTGDGDLDIRPVNMGSAQLIDLSWFHTRERMGDSLYERYSDYLATCESYVERYAELWNEYEELYNQKMILENKIPIDDSVISLQDRFDILYCIYRPVLGDNPTDDEYETSITTSLTALQNKLKTYRIEESTNARTDSVLLMMRNSETGDSAVFRIYYNEEYFVRLVFTDAAVGTTKTSDFELRDWITESISIDNLVPELKDFTISYIGTLGAFFCLAKDETKEATLNEYGLNLLLSEQAKYRAVQSVQISGGLAETKNSFTDYDFERMMQTEAPDNPSNGILWLDRTTIPSTILVYKNGAWRVPESADDIRYVPSNYENFIRYLDNYAKLYCVEQEIAARQSEIKAIDIQITLNEYRRIEITQTCDMNNYFSTEEYTKLSYYLREDEYSDSAFVVTEYMTESEVQEVRKELLNAGRTELKKRSMPQLKFSADIANLMAIPAFEGLLSQFKLGNFIHVELRHDFVKVVRLLEVDVSFDEFDHFSCTFGDMLASKNQSDIHADLLSQAATMAKSVANNSSAWQKAVEQTSQIEEQIQNGLIDADTSLRSDAVDQAISWDSTGIHLRKYSDETKTAFEAIQGWITNSGIFYSDDGFKSSRALYGKFTYDGIDYFGLIANAVIGGLIDGTIIRGGEINIGDGAFVVKSNGEVYMKNADIQNYIDSSDFAEVTGRMMYRVDVYSNGPTMFTTTKQKTTLTCKVHSWDDDITDALEASLFTWYRTNSADSVDEVYATGTKTITIDSSCISNNSRFYCCVDL